MSRIPLRQRFARAVERGDPRLGLFVGVATTLLTALAFLAPERLVFPERLELTLLDYLGFRRRAAVPESPRLAVVEIDDTTARKIAWPMPRRYYGQVVLALERLGARQAAFDVEFKMTMPREESYDPETGEHLLNPDDRFFRAAIARSGKVNLGYHVDMQDPLARLRPWAEPLKAAFAKRLGADAAELARETGAPAELLAGQIEAVREEFAAAAVADRLRRSPELSFAELKREFLPDYRPELQRADLHLLHYGYWLWKTRRLLNEKKGKVVIEGLPPRARTGVFALPPAWPFLERAAGVGCTNAEPDGVDGILRRPWAVMLFEGEPHPYLGFTAAMGDLGASLRLRPGEVVFEAPEVRRAFPVDDEGRVLVSWAGNARRPRLETFAHVPFIKLVNYFDERYVQVDGNLRRTIAQLQGELRKPHHEEYLALSDRLHPFLKSGVELDPAEMRKIEARLEEIRKRVLADAAADLAELDKAIGALDASKQRLRQRLEQQRAALAAQAGSLRVVETLEAELRPLVEGRVCFIGSAYTASGDLLPSPLHTRTPGVDVPLNVANMAFTGAALRRAPRWLDLLALLAAGLGVSVFVAHRSTTASALFTAALTGAILAGWAWAFSAASLQLSGAGPVAAGLFSFAGVTAFKELVTQRSKRKLQRELEKSTSPELVKIILEHPEILSQPHKMEGTFFFSDVKSFTSISEKMTAEVLFPFINRYLDRMTRVLKHRQAFLDKYIGDGIMALFGVPVSSADHARNACRAALECQASLAELNTEFAREGLPQLKTRIGLNSGEVSAGYMGGADRSDYSVLGDAVNLAARLEGANKEYGSSIMLSDSTRRLVGDEFVVRELDLIRVVGKRVPTGIYELLAPKGAPLPFPAEFLPAYEAALAAYKARRWAEGEEAFRQALRLKPGDLPSQYYADRCKTFQHAPPPEDWEGVFELTSK